VNLTKRADDWMNVHFLKVVNFLDGECHRLLDRARFFNVLELDEWVRGHPRIAQGVIVELIKNLVVGSSPHPLERRFQCSDSIGQHGPDGYLVTEDSFNPFVPVGKSYWEIGTNTNARAKATSDYTSLTKSVSKEIREISTFIFVTPLSGQRGWEFSSKKGAQEDWLKRRKQSHKWHDIRIIDGTKLVDWLGSFPHVALWLANKMGRHASQIETPELRWETLRAIGYPPPLTPDLFLANRTDACAKIKDIFFGPMLQLKFDTRYPGQVADFVAAYYMNMEKESNIDTLVRCLIIKDIDAWNEFTNLRERHLLVADFDIDQTDSGAKLLAKAQKSRHTVIYGGLPGGRPHPNQAVIPNPTKYQIRVALEKAGYPEDRARNIASKSDENLNSLMNFLQRLSIMPEWAQKTESADLAVAQFIASWNESFIADRFLIEAISGNPYGEWIGKIRNIASQPGTPLTHRDGVWKFTARYEGWYCLGSRLYDEHLDKLRLQTITVLSEPDPKFELLPEERFCATIKGKVTKYSHNLRRGLAESLALLGSYPDALSSCSRGKAEGTAILSVHEILKDADWILWASLNDFLPLLAEAAPSKYLDAVESALNKKPCPFDSVFAQESAGITGGNYMTGLLWSLESLAWDSEYLTRVILILGDLSKRDPGGNWGNRPSNSLNTILLPWLPQTCAPISKRKNAVDALIRENPKIGWGLLLSLISGAHQVSSGSYKPTWRELIPSDWTKGVSKSEYWEQINIYSQLALNFVKSDPTKLADFIEHYTDLPHKIKKEFLTYLNSDEFKNKSESENLPVWTQLTDLIITQMAQF